MWPSHERQNSQKHLKFKHHKMERIWSRIVEEIVSTVLTLIYRISCVFLFVPRAALSLAQRLYISCFGRNLKNKVKNE